MPKMVMLSTAAALATMLVASRAVSAQPEPAALVAGHGITALSGRIVDASGAGLARVRVVDNATSTYTDAQGRFLLAPVPVGKSVVQIDGRHVKNGTGPDYGFHEIRAVAKSAETTPVGFTSWLSPIDHAHDITVASPTTQETVLRTPAIPGLEIHIAPNTVIRDAEGKIVTRIGITALRPDKQPIALPDHVAMPLAFTVQPGAACLYTPSGGISYARVIYPNLDHQLPRARLSFWRYEPDANGWRIYGAGTVSDDGTQVVPDRNTVMTDFGSAECDPATRSRPLIIAVPSTAPGAIR